MKGYKKTGKQDTAAWNSSSILFSAYLVVETANHVNRSDDVAADFRTVDDLTCLAAVAKVAEGDSLFFGIGFKGVIRRDVRNKAHANEPVVEGILGRFTVVGGNEFVRADLF